MCLQPHGLPWTEKMATYCAQARTPSDYPIPAAPRMRSNRLSTFIYDHLSAIWTLSHSMWFMCLSFIGRWLDGAAA